MPANVRCPTCGHTRTISRETTTTARLMMTTKHERTKQNERQN